MCPVLIGITGSIETYFTRGPRKDGVIEEAELPPDSTCFSQTADQIEGKQLNCADSDSH